MQPDPVARSKVKLLSIKPQIPVLLTLSLYMVIIYFTIFFRFVVLKARSCVWNRTWVYVIRESNLIRLVHIKNIKTLHDWIYRGSHSEHDLTSRI